jgi:hypothetical protein
MLTPKQVGNLLILDKLTVQRQPVSYAINFYAFTVRYPQPRIALTMAPLTPVIASVYRDTSNSPSFSTKSVIGEMPKVFWVDVSNYTPGAQIVLGSTNYRVFPLVQKWLPASGGIPFVDFLGGGTITFWHTGIFGIAVQE